MDTDNKLARFEQAQLTKQIYSQAQIATVVRTLVPGGTVEDAMVFLRACEDMNLSPFRKQVHAVMRNTKVGNEWVKKMTIQTGIDGFRTIAMRSGLFEGYHGEAELQTPAGEWIVESEWDTGITPVRARMSGYRKGFREPVSVSVRWDAYVQTTGQGDLTSMWRQRGIEQLVKCCEAALLRKIAPDDVGGIYLDEEFANHSDSKPVQPKQVLTNSMPAQPKVEPAAEIEEADFEEINDADTDSAGDSGSPDLADGAGGPAGVDVPLIVQPGDPDWLGPPPDTSGVESDVRGRDLF